jgi:hypothetical protein
MADLSQDTCFLPSTHPPAVQSATLPDDIIHKRLNVTMQRVFRLPAPKIVQTLAAIDRQLLNDCLTDVTIGVAQALRVDHAEMLSPSRCQHLVFCRQVAMYLCRKLTGASYPILGEHFGHRHHSTVIHAIDLIERRMADSNHGPLFTKLINQLEAQIIGTVPATEAAA